MASSQVEIVASSPFGCVLRDHRNRRDHNVRTAAHATFEKNLKVLVRDHIKTCISISDQEAAATDTSASNHIDSWIADGQINRGGTNNQNQNPTSTSSSNNIKNVVNNDAAAPPPNKQAHSRIIDRLAAKQARQIASAIEKQAQDAAADIIISPAAAASHDNNNNNSISSSNESSPSDNNARASSLVQIWEARLNRMDSLEKSPTAAIHQEQVCASRNSEQASIQLIEDDWESQSAAAAAATTEDQTMITEAAEPTTYCLSNKEKERVRVVDIIKRLYNETDIQQQDHHHHHVIMDNHSPTRSLRNRIPASAEQQQGQGGISLVVHSPKLRGRQAFQDMLMQMERDRHKELDSLLERHAVSKFPQRGRIQSVLRLRCLQRGLIISHSSGPLLLNKIRTNSKSTPTTQESNITQLREKFSSSKSSVLTQSDQAAASARTRRKEMANATQQHPSTKTSTKNPVPPSTEQVSRKPPVVPLPENTTHPTTKQPVPSSTEQVKSKEKISSSICDQPTIILPPKKNAVESNKTNNESCTSTSVEQRKPQPTVSLESQNTKKEAPITCSTDVAAQEENQMAKEKDALNQKLLDLESLQSSSEEKKIAAIISSSNNVLPIEKNEMVEEGDRGNNQQLVPFLDSQEIVETRTFFNDWDETVEDEEEEDYQQYFEESNYDWFSDISRPRSYWESLRQAWYEEVLNNNNNTKEDKGIRQLLERRSVSTILASDFRDKMDRLVMSRVEMQVEQEESKEDELDEEERSQQVMSYLKKHLDETTDQEDERLKEVVGKDEDEDEEDEDEEEDEEGGSTSSQQCHQETCGGYYSQSSPSVHMPSPLVISWSYQDDTETSDHDSHSRQRPSPSPAPPPQSYQSSSQLSSSTRPSLEMELICELRGQMEQLYREMGELKKSIVSSMDMQMKVHQSGGVGGGQGKNEADTDSDRVLLKQTCCICYEKQVDSILYRCGHMCTCLKCAHALQWSSGKCPTCRAPIVDVVQAIVGSPYVQEESNQ